MNRQSALSWVAIGVALAGLLVWSAHGDGTHQRVSLHSPSTSPTIDPTSRRPLSTDLHFQTDADTTTGETAYRFTVTNFGDSTITIVSVGESGPGLRLLEGTADPRTLPPHGKATITARFKVEDCGQISTRSWPFPVTFKTTGDEATTQYLELLGSTPDMQWQTAAAEAICHPQSATL